MERTDQQFVFFLELLSGVREMSTEEIEVRARCLGIGGICPPFRAVTVAPDYHGVPFAEKDEILLNVQNFLEKELRENGLNFFAMTDAYSNVRILLFAAPENSRVEAMFRLFHEKIEERFQLQNFIGIGAATHNSDEIYLSSAESQRMLSYKYQYAEHGVVSAENLLEFRYNTMMGSDIFLERCVGCFLDGNLPMMSRRIEELVEHVRHRDLVSRTSIRRTLIELTVRILNMASNANIDVDSILGDRDVYHWILSQSHTEIITGWIMELSARLISEMQEQNSTESKKAVSMARIFIERKLSDPELGLESLAEHVQLTPQYFSILFKKEIGVGPKAYIVQRRMERAKYLLEKTAIGLEGIALQVGYSRIQYFNASFKKQVGVTPGEYRRKIKMKGQE